MKKNLGFCKKMNVFKFKGAFQKRGVSTYINKGVIGVFKAIQGLGQAVEGTENAPMLLQKSGLMERLKSVGARVIDKGTIIQEKEDWVSKSANKLAPRQIVNAFEVGKFCKNLRDQVRRNAMEGNFSLTIGGCQRSVLQNPSSN